MSAGQTIFTIVILLLLNAFFSVAEYSIASSRKLKLEQLLINGNIHAKKVLDLSSNPNQFITVIQVGLNIVAILAGIFGENSFAPYFRTELLLIGVNESYSLLISVALSVLLITAIFIIFSELIPKQLAFSNPEVVACRIISPLLMVLVLFKPFVWLLSSIANVILRACNVTTVRDDSMTFEEVSAIIDQSAMTGLLEEKEHHLIENVFSLNERNVLSVMTPRNEIIYFDLNETAEDISNKVLNKPHSRFLVCDSEVDHILGYVESSTLLKNILTKQSVTFNREKLKEQGLKTVLVIPESLNLLDVLDKFRESRQDFAVVINEFATVTGLITLNDVLGTLMGNVVSSMENELIVPRAENSWLIDGTAAIESVKKLFDWNDLPGQQSFETISGFLMYNMKCIPKKAQTFEYRNVKFEIVDVDGYRIDEVMATIMEAKAQATTAE
jgi:CBS domain containing-hemolysin-like protein